MDISIKQHLVNSHGSKVEAFVKFGEETSLSMESVTLAQKCKIRIFEVFLLSTILC